MDASEYKDYVLVLLFVRYVSDNYPGKKDEIVVVPEGGSLGALVKLKGKTNICCFKSGQEGSGRIETKKHSWAGYDCQEVCV